MPRPRLPDELLKHPRTFRKSTVTPSTRIKIKKPTKAAKAFYKALETACVDAIFAAAPKAGNIAKRVRIKIILPTWIELEKFPQGQCLDENKKILTVNAEMVLLWLYERGLAKHSPTELYKMKHHFTIGLGHMEAELDRMLDLDYNDVLGELGNE